MLDFILWVREFAEHNQFFSGVAGASVIGGVIYWLRTLPHRVMNAVIWATSIQIEIGNDCDMFPYIDEWMGARVSWHTRMLKIRDARAQASGYARPYDEDEEEGTPSGWVLTPGRGAHWVRHRGWPFYIYRVITNEAQTNGPYVREVLYIRTPGFRRLHIDALLADVKTMLTREDLTNVFVRRGMNGWKLLDRRRPRPLDTIVLPSGETEAIAADVDRFLRNAGWYLARGVPYRRGYLFSGPPGTGKSSLAVALAGHFKMPVYALNLGSVLTDTDLMEAVGFVPANAILLLEDIDTVAVVSRRDISEPKAPAPIGITLSALLNCLDGAVAKEGRILVLTTNHPERIDPALIRPGRVDYTVRFANAGPAEAAAMFARFFPERPELAERIRTRYRLDLSPASIQDLCLVHHDNPAAAAHELTRDVPRREIA